MQPNIEMYVLYDISKLTMEIYKSNSIGQMAEMPPTHRDIYRIWQQLLKYDNFNLDDDLFKVGGDSIAAIQIISAINKEFDIDIPMDELFSSERFSINWLAELVEIYQFDLFDNEEYSALLNQIDGLSEDEAKKLLLAED